MNAQDVVDMHDRQGELFEFFYPHLYEQQKASENITAILKEVSQ